ncbi:hypothetical protein EYF80_029981 [Liparis tanakae]|uniref:Uncharacterized protein n=1 Tax=Liparis tanakae TaxID=230148 RepID=A0A4Z2H1Y5_9TELE|nr:hypothetical protein EYF80_029981 [Liparis tanakae]
MEQRRSVAPPEQRDVATRFTPTAAKGRGHAPCIGTPRMHHAHPGIKGVSLKCVTFRQLHA